MVIFKFLLRRFYCAAQSFYIQTQFIGSRSFGVIVHFILQFINSTVLQGFSRISKHR